MAVVSTGSDVWSLKVRGQLVNETWNNIGVNWTPYKNQSDLPHDERGGLEVMKMLGVFNRHISNH